MGQKVNPEIFRIGKLNNNWKSKYIENKTTELSTFFFKSLEIKIFLKRFMLFHGLNLHKCKIGLSNTSLNLVISYYTAKLSTQLIKQNYINIKENVNINNNIDIIYHEKKTKVKKIIKTLIKTYYRWIKIAKNSKKKRKNFFLNSKKKRKNFFLNSKKKRKKFFLNSKKKRKNFFLNSKKNFFNKKLKNYIKKKLELKYKKKQKIREKKRKKREKKREKKRKKREEKLKKSNITISPTFFFVKKKKIRKKSNIIIFPTYFFVKKKKNFFQFYKQYRYVRKWIRKKMKTKRLRSIYTKRVKEHYNISKYKNKKSIKSNSFAEYLLENLTNYIGRKYSIFITLRNLKMKNLKDSYLKQDVKFFKKKLNFSLYNKYKRYEFFETAKRIIFVTIRKKKSAQFLADFISSQLNRLKKQQKVFLKFIKEIFEILIKKTKSSTKLYGIKIIIKGRLNKARRAKNRTFKILIGNVPLQQIKSSIDNAKSTSYNVNGTFGTEVWLNYFNKI